jgi:undecaprenyl diphosphate synthase
MVHLPESEKEIKDRLRAGNLPGHIAIIMDGNGRWAKKRGLPRVAGHREGVNAVRAVVEGCAELGIGVLTLYTFSTENWKRPADEVSALMRLLMKTLRKELEELVKNNIRMMTIGDITRLPKDAYRGMLEGIETTKSNTGLILNLALNYGGREEILSAVQSIAQSAKQGDLEPEAIDANTVQTRLYTNQLPDPDLLIRTSGEFRLSNFLLWQMAYTEIHITDVYWPDFRRNHLYEAIADYQKRERRFGKVSEQIQED